MKKIVITFLMCACALISVGQTSIWKISKNGKTLYLGGSVHILRATDYPLPSEFDAAFQKADKVVFEADIKKLEDPQVAQGMMIKSMLPNGQTLNSILNEKVYNELNEECKKLSIPLTNLNKFKPSMVILMLTLIKMQQIGVSEEGVDKYFYQKSEKENKEISFLESVETQINLLTKMGEGNENKYVKYSLKSFDDLDKELETLIETWKDGSSKVMKRQLKEMKADYPQLHKDLLVTRNNNWMPKIERFLQDAKTEFVIVGALHLHGPNGLLKQLKDKGYHIEQYTL